MQTQLSPSQTVQANALPSARVDENAPLEAFGGGASEAGVTAAASGLATTAGDLAMQQIDRANQVAHLDAVNKAQDAATQLQVQVSQMRGKDALQAPDLVNKQWGDTVDKIRSSLSNGTQQAAFDRSSADLYHALNHTTQTHVAQQMEEYDDQTTSAAVANFKTAAVLNADQPDIVSDNIAKQTAVMKDYFARKGIPLDSDIAQQKLTDTLSATHTGVIQAQLDAGNTTGADTYFAANKDSMNAADALHMQKAIESNKDISLGMDIYSDVKGMKLANGMPNEAAMEKDVMSRDDLSDEKKQRMWTYVKAQARDAIFQKAQEDRANDQEFNNQITEARKNGVPLADAYKIAQKFGDGSYDTAIKEAAIQNLYAPPSNSDQSVKYGLWQGIQNGTVDNGAIDTAMRNGQINKNDWNSLKEENYKATIEGRSPEMKKVNNDILDLAKTTYGGYFGGDTQAQKEVVNVINDKSVGKSPVQKWIIANDEMKNVDSHSKFWNFLPLIGGHDIPLTGSETPQYQIDLEKSKNDNLIMGSMANDIGGDAMSALHAGAVKSGQDFSPMYMDQFQQAFGGTESIKPGTPVNNAIKSLDSLGKTVNIDTVKQALANVPDGNFGNTSTPTAQTTKVKIPYLPRGKH